MLKFLDPVGLSGDSNVYLKHTLICIPLKKIDLDKIKILTILPEFKYSAINIKAFVNIFRKSQKTLQTSPRSSNLKKRRLSIILQTH